MLKLIVKLFLRCVAKAFDKAIFKDLEKAAEMCFNEL